MSPQVEQQERYRLVSFHPCTLQKPKHSLGPSTDFLGVVAIWDNRSVIHQPTFDYDAYGERFGWRVSATGEHPYFDSTSISRREALRLEGNIL